MKFADLDLDKTYTYADYYGWDFEDRVELIKGRIFKMSPSPSMWHQRLSSRLHIMLGRHLDGKKCEAFSAPFDVRLPRKSKEDKDIITVLQPDICVVCDPSILDSRGCLGAPDVTVEILSPSNNVTELKNKYEAYEEAGVKEYWVVSPQDKTFLCYTLTGGHYQASRLMVAGDIFASSVLKDFNLDLAVLFKDLD